MGWAQGELRGQQPRRGGGDWDSHASDLDATITAPTPEAIELAEFRARLYVSNRRRAQEAVSPEAWALSRATHGHE